MTYNVFGGTLSLTQSINHSHFPDISTNPIPVPFAIRSADIVTAHHLAFHGYG